jgi:hypothetical protein
VFGRSRVRPVARTQRLSGDISQTSQRQGCFDNWHFHIPYKRAAAQTPEHQRHVAAGHAAGYGWRGGRVDDVASGRVTTVQEICVREQCSARQVNMTISLAFLAPNLVKAAVEGRLPRGIGVERLRDPPAEWSRQFEALGLNPE